MKILVTGGAGFIGSHVVDALVSAGHTVTVVDSLVTGSKENINSAARFVQFDITSPNLAEIFAECRPETVFHLAAQIDVRKSVADPVGDATVNIIGSLNVLEAARQSGVRHFIFASSGGAVYGDTKNRPTPEGNPEQPASPYGIAKLTVEHYLRVYGVQYGLRTVALRYSNVYGPRQNALGEAGVVAIFCRKLIAGEEAVINGDGEQTRDYVYVADVVSANLAALAYGKSGVFNIGTGVEISVNAVADRIRSSIKSGSLLHGPGKSGEQRTSCLNCQLARQELSWKSDSNFEQGITQTVAWFRHQ